jgi:hypothetical protein
MDFTLKPNLGLHSRKKEHAATLPLRPSPKKVVALSILYLETLY